MSKHGRLGQLVIGREMSTPLYGLELPRGEYELRYQSDRDVIGKVETSASGNIVLRIGRELGHGGPWTQIAHVVLAPDEARRFCKEIAVALRGNGGNIR